MSGIKAKIKSIGKGTRNLIAHPMESMEQLRSYQQGKGFNESLTSVVQLCFNLLYIAIFLIVIGILYLCIHVIYIRFFIFSHTEGEFLQYFDVYINDVKNSLTAILQNETDPLTVTKYYNDIFYIFPLERYLEDWLVYTSTYSKFITKVIKQRYGKEVNYELAGVINSLMGLNFENVKQIISNL